MKKIFLLILLVIPCFLYSQKDTTVHVQLITGYYNDFYSQPYNRTFHVYYAGLGYKSENTTIYGKVNYGNLSYSDNGSLLIPKMNAIQYELDYYQRITKSTTSWWNYAYSNDVGFPDHRFMVRVWQKLSNSFLVSGGVSYFNFVSDDTYSINLGIEKYMGNYWFEYRTFLYFQEPKNTTSHYISARRFFKDINYLQLSIGYGPNDDEPWDINNYDRLSAYRVGLLYVTNLGERFRIRTGINYSYENYNTDFWRNRYSFNIGLTYNIK